MRERGRRESRVGQGHMGEALAIRVGVDENGLGPRLGPLVVTAITARTAGEGHARAEGRPRGAMRARLGDSKTLISHGDTSLGEAWARAIARRMGMLGTDDGP